MIDEILITLIVAKSLVPRSITHPRYSPGPLIISVSPLINFLPVRQLPTLRRYRALPLELNPFVLLFSLYQYPTSHSSHLASSPNRFRVVSVRSLGHPGTGRSRKGGAFPVGSCPSSGKRCRTRPFYQKGGSGTRLRCSYCSEYWHWTATGCLVPRA